MSAGAKRLWRSVGIPLIGFGVGWGAFTAMERSEVLSESTQRWLNVHNLKLQLYTQRLLPASLVQRYGYPEDTLRSMIEYLEKGYSEAEVSERMTFEEVLKQCAVTEQMAYLEEHASEEIPYFYIADIFHSWANLNARSFAQPAVKAEDDASSTDASTGAAQARPPPPPPLVLRNDPEFDSEILCSSLYDKMLHNVIPFDVSIRALCVLAVNNKANAKRLARTCSPDDIARLYSDYADKVVRERAKATVSQPDDAVAPAEVTAATLFFLRAVNDASVHTRWVPLLGAPSTGPYPLARTVQPERWCRAFGDLRGIFTGQTAETASVLVEVMNTRLQCAELRKAESVAEGV